MKGIMFNSEYGMWEAVLLGTKTNTRRTGKAVEAINKHQPDQWRLMVMDEHRFKMRSSHTNAIQIVTPRYKVGDICYLQEPTLDTAGTVTKDRQIFYNEKDHNGHTDKDAYKQVIDQAVAQGAKWKNKKFMFAEDARYFVKITDVKLERLQDITPEDCLKEGLHHKTSLGNKIFRLYEEGKYYKDPEGKFTRDAKQSYESLFKLVNDPAQWDNNYWCLSYYFALLTPREVALHKQQIQNDVTIK